MDFTEIKGETKRTYVYPPSAENPQGFRYEVKDVVRLHVRPSGSHRLETAEGLKLVVMPGFKAIEVEAPAWSV